MPPASFMRNRLRPSKQKLAQPAIAKNDRPQTPSVSQDVVAKTEIYTYFTEPDGQTRLLMSATKWTRVRLTLETAGPVAIGTAAVITPVLSGKGVLLPTGQELEFVLPRGDRLYIASDSANRVKVILEPVAYGEQILQAILSLAGMVRR